jgi:hypothetical protein
MSTQMRVPFQETVSTLLAAQVIDDHTFLAVLIDVKGTMVDYKVDEIVGLSKYLKQAQNPAEQATLERTRKCGWQWI